MTLSTHERIRDLIEDTNNLFENCGGVNTDYADFATIALADFKRLLGDPSLTDRQLKQLIRKADRSHKTMNQKASWAVFMAEHIAEQANSNRQLQSV